MFFTDRNVRFDVNETDSAINSTTSSSSSLSSNETTTRRKLKSKTLNSSSSSSHEPKRPSNLVKSTIPSFSSSTKPDLVIYDRGQLIEFLKEREQTLLTTRNEYEHQYENFFSLAKRFHIEKLNNLKLTFKNQILKQQIYFESELLELSKECSRDYESSVKNSNSHSNKNRKQQNEQHLIRLFKLDMKKLIDYMRESLLNSTDTLIEAYETCQVLKQLEQIETNLVRQNQHLKQSTSRLIKSDNDKQDEDVTAKQLTDEQILIDKHKQEMDELMHTLDDIELQHLQRKEQLATKTKFFNKLKSKFKFIETKYDTLTKQISNLKYESYVYKKLWYEKQRTDATVITTNITSSSGSSSNSGEWNYCSKSSVLSSSSLSPSTSSRSSSTSSLSECIAADLAALSSSSNENSNNLVTADDHTPSDSVSSSSSSSLSNQDLSDLTSGEYEDATDLLPEELNTTNQNSLYINQPSLTNTDYNRKLSIINDLINLHKAKSTSNSSKDLWSMPTSSLSNFLSANFRLDDENDDMFLKLDLSDDKKPKLNDESRMNNSYCNQADCSLDLASCSTDGDLVIVENCNLKSDSDISNWYLTRQIENIQNISRYQLPTGSVVKSGKILRIDEPFANDQLNFLIAIKNQLENKQTRMTLKIKTSLVSPDGTIKTIHTQEIPKFYTEIFKYANLIQLL